ncbi:MAG: hypothetical protein IJV07_05980 [Alphaproteobacteria bacterium]|nr:hypothetical protein [Alphaproteobacteria bacterium]
MSDELKLSDIDFEDFVPDLTDSDADVAYIKREIVNFQPIYAIYDGTGQRLGQAPTRLSALLFIERNDLIPQDVH